MSFSAPDPIADRNFACDRAEWIDPDISRVGIRPYVRRVVQVACQLSGHYLLSPEKL